MQRRLLAFSIALLGITWVACGDDDDITVPVSKIINFTAGPLSGANENPVNTSAGTGTFVATLDTSTNVFTYDLQVSGLPANVNNGHIHGPAAVGVNAGTTINFNTLPGATFSAFGATSGTAHGVVTLNASTAITSTINGDSLKKLLLAGLTYVNIHTTAIPAGAIRAQIVRAP